MKSPAHCGTFCFTGTVSNLLFERLIGCSAALLRQMQGIAEGNIFASVEIPEIAKLFVSRGLQYRKKCYKSLSILKIALFFAKYSL